MNSDEPTTPFPVAYADDVGEAIQTPNAPDTWTDSATEWMNIWMSVNQFPESPYEDEWAELFGKVGLHPSNIEETVQRFLTARLEAKVAAIKKSLVEEGRIKKIAPTEGGSKPKIINQNEAVKALIDQVYSDPPGFEEIMEAAYGQWNESKLSTTEDLLAEQSLDNRGN